jgi:hypothetical protein
VGLVFLVGRLFVRGPVVVLNEVGIIDRRISSDVIL